MPELPEVEVAVRRLRDAVVGRVIARVRALHPAVARTLPTDDPLRARRVVRVERRGKHQLLYLDDGAIVHAHFRMAGDWAVVASGGTPRFARAVIDFVDGSALALVDPRALSTLAVIGGEGAERALPALGPEANDPAFDADELGRRLATRRGPIKPALLDQSVVAGLGNIYAAEALWRARISPRARASALGPVRRARLVDAVRATIADALAAPGRYAAADGPARGRTAVYGRAGEPCPRCGAAVRRAVQGGRSTYYCPRCQAR